MLVIGLVDNLLRPFLVGKGTKLRDYVVVRPSRSHAIHTRRLRLYLFITARLHRGALRPRPTLGHKNATDRRFDATLP